MRILDVLGLERRAEQRSDGYEHRVRRLRTQAWQEVDPVLLWIPILLMFFGLILLYLLDVGLKNSGLLFALNSPSDSIAAVS